jgi:transcriptional regulator with XRE-family HTH domain
MDLVKNIKELRKKYNISQEVIANALSVDTAVVSNIEKGKRELKVCELEKIANAIGVDVLYLITYPDRYVKTENSMNNSTKVLVEIDVSTDEFIKMGLKEKIIQVLNK